MNFSLLFASLMLFSTLSLAEGVTTETITLSPDECAQVAVRVAIETYVLNGGMVEKKPQITKNAELVSKYVVDNNKEVLVGANPTAVYQGLLDECVEAEGKTILPLVVSN